MKNEVLITIFLLFIFAISSCSNINIDKQIKKKNNKQNYLNQPPQKEFSSKLKNISRSVVRPQCYVTYKQYAFPKSEQINRDSLDQYLMQREEYTEINRQTSVGSGTILDSNKDSILILSSAHIFEYPDSVFKYFNEKEYQNSLSIFSEKTSQKQYIVAGGQIISLEIFEKSQSEDIILLIGKNVSDSTNISEMPVAFGQSNNLQLGNYIYFFGYPTGRKMISNGIVSPSKREKDFLINTPFNRGMSGGPIFAINNQGKFEMVGMGRSSAAEHHYLLSPNSDMTQEYNKAVPYQGKSYVQKESLLRYGVTFAVGGNTIIKFLESKENSIKEAGFNLEGLYSRQDNES